MKRLFTLGELTDTLDCIEGLVAGAGNQTRFGPAHAHACLPRSCTPRWTVAAGGAATG